MLPPAWLWCVCRWEYQVRNGDVVVMRGDCQQRLQHCVKVEKRAEDAGPRMSLVFKVGKEDEGVWGL